jgi:hypothetical protein
VKPLLEFQLTDKVIMHVKNEGSNLNTLVITLSSVVSCALLQVEQPFVGFCFGHAMPKACQYAMNDTKFCEGRWEVSLKNAHVSLITNNHLD